MLEAGPLSVDVLLDLTLIAAILGLGIVICRLVLGDWDWLWIAALAFPLGSGVLTWVTFLVSWLGLPIRGLTVGSVLLGLAAVSLVLLWRRPRGWPGGAPPRPSPLSRGDLGAGWIAAILAAAALLILAANSYLSVVRAYSVWDAIAIWSIKGYGISMEGSVFAAERWGAHGLAYPLHLPLLIAFFDLAGGDLLPGSKLVFSIFFASLMVGAYGFSRRAGLSRAIAAVTALSVGSLPVLFKESTTGYANAPLTVYLGLGAMMLLEGLRARSPRSFVLGGLLLGLAGWTRVEGPFYALVVLSAGVWLPRLSGRRLPGWGWAAVPILIIWIPWFAFYRLHGAAGSQAMGALSAALDAIRQGDLHLGPLRLILQAAAAALVDTRTWGWLWPVAVAFAGLRYRAASDPQRAGFIAGAAMAVGAAAVTVLLFYVGSFSTPGLPGWLERSFDRELMPSPVFLFLGAVWLLSGDRSSFAEGSGRPDTTGSA